MDFDEDLIGEAPCEFCGELYPLMLLIEHQSIHLADGDYFPLDEVLSRDEIRIINDSASTPVVAEPEIIFEQKQTPVRNEPEIIFEQKQTSVRNEPEIIIEEKQQSSDNNKTKASEEIAKPEKKRSSPEYSDEIVISPASKHRRISYNSGKRNKDIDVDIEMESDDGDDNDESYITEIKAPAESLVKEQSVLFSKALKDIKKFPEQKAKEFATEKGEKLLVYGDDIDPDKESESEKQAYKMPNNPLLSSVRKNEDVADINSLSDDDCDESLEEFWKRAREFLKKNRGRSDC